MPDLASAFPRRPLTLRQPVGLLRLLLFGGFGLALVAAGAVWLATQLGPDLLDDFAIRDTARPVADARLVSGRCTSHFGVIHHCEVTLSRYGKFASEQRRDEHYLFADFHTGDYTVNSLLADPERPDIVTTDIGLGRLWNRAALLLGMALLVLIGAIGLFVYAGGVRHQRKIVRSLSGQILSPVPLRLVARANGSWVVQTPDGRRHDWEVGRYTRPFSLDPGRGLILGVTAPGGAAAMPLDDRLRWLRLDKAEQAALLAHRAAA